MDRAIGRQVEFALNEAEVILFVVDGREGLNPVDRAIAERLRKAGRPVVLAVNKLDNLEQQHRAVWLLLAGVWRAPGDQRGSGEGQWRPARRGGRAAAAL